MQSIENKVKSRIYGKGRGWCFTQKHFSDLGSSDSIRKALSKLEKANFIRRLAFGLYDYPRTHEELGEMPAKVENVIKAITEKELTKFQPSGAYAANLLGLSEQVPAKIVILTEGSSKKIKIGNVEISFKKTTPKNMATAGTVTGLVIQALRFIGKEKITDEIRNKLKKTVTEKESLKRLKLDIEKGLAPDWIAKIIKTDLLGSLNG